MVKKKRLSLLLVLSLSSFITRASGPEPEYWTRPDSLGLEYVEKVLTTSGSAQLLSWHLPTKASKPLRKTLVIAYALTGNMANCVYYANAFLKAGFDVVLFDYRGFGHSSKFVFDSRQIYHDEFVTNLKTAITAAKAQFPANETGVLSFSASTILATLAYQSTPFDFLVAEGFASDLPGVVSFWKKEEDKVFTLPASAVRYPKAIADIKCPMLLLAGTKDEITPLAEIKKVLAQRPNRRLLTYEDGHLQGTSLWQEKEFADGYVRRIKDFARKIE